MRGVSGKTVYIVRRLLKNLEDESVDHGSYSFLSFLCRELAEVAYSIHEELLKRGDEVAAVKVFEQLHVPFLTMADFFEKLSEKREAEQ